MYGLMKSSDTRVKTWKGLTPVQPTNTPFGIASNASPVRTTFNLIRREELKRLSQDEGMTDAEIARLYNVSTNQVYHRRRVMNLIQGQRTAHQLAYIVRLSEAVKNLPDEAITQIESIVSQYTPGFEGPQHME